MSFAFVPGFAAASPRFLGRFLSPIADGAAAHYVSTHSRPGDIVLDPFGQSPSVAVEALSLDRRIVVASINPILRLALSLAVRPPALSELKSALTALGDAHLGPGRADRLEAHIKALYQTTCTECRSPVSADAFDWDAEAGEPIGKHYVCLSCGGPRSAPVDDEDRALAARFSRGGPDYFFLLSRAGGIDAADRAQAEETLAVYPARTLAAIGVVVMKLEALSLDREARRLLAGLLVAAFDAATVLAQERPKVLAVPRHYREVNFWLALENGLGLLAGAASPDRSATLEQLLAQPAWPAIHAHAGPVRGLAGHLPAGACPLILTAPPRPNQAFWNLSAAWAAWLWDREATDAFRATLHRRRYDWTWHARALHQSLFAARPMIATDGRLVCLLAETEPGFSASVVSAAAGAGYGLKGWALRADTGEAQLEWEVDTAALIDSAPPEDAAHDPAPPDDQPTDTLLAREVRLAALSVLRLRAEPSRWASLHFAAWCGLAANGRLSWPASDPLAPVNRALESVSNDAVTFQHLSEGSGTDPASGLWFLNGQLLAEHAAGERPLADRVETEVAGRLMSSDLLDEHDLLRDLYGALPGPLTPGRGLVLACLASYGLKDQAGNYQHRPEDVPEARAQEMQEILAALRAMAGRHGYEAAGVDPLEWRQDGQVVYEFAVLASAEISRYLLEPHTSARRRFLVVPGGRAGLVDYKLRRDPRLRQALTGGSWTILKFRQVRQMVADETMARATLEPALGDDPLESLKQLTLPEAGRQAV